MIIHVKEVSSEASFSCFALSLNAFTESVVLPLFHSPFIHIGDFAVLNALFAKLLIFPGNRVK